LHAKEFCCCDWRFGENPAQLGTTSKATQWASSYPITVAIIGRDPWLVFDVFLMINTGRHWRNFYS
jgi:hypothetical protein